MMIRPQTRCTAFEGNRCIATGTLPEVAPIARRAVHQSANEMTPPAVLVFDDTTSEVIELDWRGDEAAFMARLNLRMDAAAEPTPDDWDETTKDGSRAEEAPRGPGRPRLGVVAREVTLLPRHWEWLSRQSGGASVALRKLVEAARRASEQTDRVRQARDAAYRFMSTMAGHEAGFEEASRALFAGDQARFAAQISAWPVDVQTHLNKLLTGAFEA
ncbi:MAG: DUF2239 family protein [Burkholderiaceae bacterium]|nr:DUF2239 family protein [Burkholderiaceae bacterium]